MLTRKGADHLSEDQINTARKIEFWFDFSSGYAFFAAQEIEALGKRTGRQVLWRPFMLGAAFKHTGAKGLSSTPMKAEYALHDWERIARLQKLQFRLPPGHPYVALAATRAFYWIEDAKSAATAARFAQRMFEEYFHNGLDTNNADAVADVAVELGCGRQDVVDGISSPEIKSITRAHCDDAIARGVFGSPFFFADNEPFWGWDRMTMMEDWITSNGW